MSGLWILEMACDDVVDYLSRRLNSGGLQVMPSFDLQTARQSLKDPQACSCPHHGTAECTCQYVILLLRGAVGGPITLAAHGHDGVTVLSLDPLVPAGAVDEVELLVQAAVAGLMPAMS